MQALRNSARVLMRAAQGTRGMATKTAEEYWAPYFPKNKPVTAAENQKALRKEMFGFLLLGPAGAGLMLYDFVVGLEEEHEVVIPPYPWMRIRRFPGMPWGDDCLFEYHPRVAKEWPPAEGLPEKGHH
mmetsp:Transcript_4872/g.10462  ORF Transcript_4872/g.10462 Transcript_4872/m.10462 type:complete len:128 (+) Transcript_4872:163-546(+)|eukprot:CAMPEP_0202899914 /NCGR_PEP_ID=MMETSP1392-20130828/9308_1 /ASSEMBLY_ACC=CAM_ASM_000868 /TAXON_ID=225041 /ORGANISM="Chlamydomonas chlamydogama, Strain SAG 11-48b" /LENGTH=127 /DNA_ID=CAMNT_0049586211 /DNA_START=148 /DNA_END=531 /DNA_ORIENTATION=+